MRLVLPFLLLFPAASAAQRAPVLPGIVQTETPSVLFSGKLSNATKGFEDTLDPNDLFGTSVAAIGDLDGNGVEDIAVGAPGDDDGGGIEGGRGAVWALLRGPAGIVRARQKISVWEGGFAGTLPPGAALGAAITGLGDLDGDGVEDIAVGAPGTRAGAGSDIGAVWLLFLRSNGRVKSAVKIDRSTPGLVAGAQFLGFGTALASPGDWNGDGVPDLVVGEFSSSARIWLLLLKPDGSLVGSVETPLAIAGSTKLAFLDDLDGDGLRELATCASGPVSVVFLAADGSVRSSRQVAGLDSSLVGAGDYDGDGLADLILSPRGLDGVQVLHLAADGSVVAQATSLTLPLFSTGSNGAFDKSIALLGERAATGALELAMGAPGSGVGTQLVHGTLFLFDVVPGLTPTNLHRQGHEDGKMAGTLDPHEGFGSAVTAVGDIDRDGIVDLALGLSSDERSGLRLGSTWIAFLAPDGSVKRRRRISSGESDFAGVLHDFDRFGFALASPGDIDGDGTPDLVVGAAEDDDGGPPQDLNSNEGAIWVLFLRPDGSVKHHVKISAVRGGFHGELSPGDFFGSAVAAAGDLDGNGVCDLFVGAPGDDDGGLNKGAVWILQLRRDGSCRAEQKISLLAGGFGGALADNTRFGAALASLGDVDRDGVGDLAVGAPQDGDGGFRRGAAWVLFLGRDGRVRSQQKLSATSGGFVGPLANSEAFGTSVAGPGDLDGDGTRDLLVGATGGGAGSPGAVWLLSLERIGRVARETRITEGSAGFAGDLDGNDFFGSALALLGDPTQDGLPEIAVGAVGDDDHRAEHGAVWLLALDGAATLDFEHGEHGLAALDGQALAGALGHGAGIRLETSGANLGAALFDSGRGGPNDPSQDPDLLVGRGNVLILQDSLHATQSFAGTFDQPNDDADGGVLRFVFAHPIAPRSLDLIDVDAGASSFVRVRLGDELGGVRSYDVPAGWTGDRTVDGTSGVATLDLATLAPQPGFRSTATATESAAFAGDRVVAVEVQLGSSGAIDDLRFDPHP